jgi:hypothetical protein
MSDYMIPKAKELKLISIYLYICDIYESSLKNVCERLILLHKKHYYHGLKLHALAYHRPRCQLHLYF